MERLRIARKERLITMKRLGEIVGVSESAISQYENGKRQPDNETLKRIADVLDVSVDYLLGRSDAPAPLGIEQQLTGIDFALYGETKDLTDEEKQDILDYVRYKKSKK